MPPRARITTVVALDIAVKAMTVGLLAFAILSPDLPQFQGKAFAGRAIAYPIALLLVPVGWWLVGRGRIPFPVASDILFSLPFLIDVAGNAADLYDTIEWWDDANHLVNWALQTAAAGLVLRYAPWSWRVRAAMGFAYAVTSAVLWEFAEYVTFVPNSPEAASAYADTLGDIALGMVGGLLASVATARLPSLREDRPPPPASSQDRGLRPAGGTDSERRSPAGTLPARDPDPPDLRTSGRPDPGRSAGSRVGPGGQPAPASARQDRPRRGGERRPPRPRP